MPESIKDKNHVVHTEPGNALSGDQILIQCRKSSQWTKTQGSKQHHYFYTVARMNAYAVLKKKFTNLQK